MVAGKRSTGLPGKCGPFNKGIFGGGKAQHRSAWEVWPIQQRNILPVPYVAIEGGASRVHEKKLLGCGRG